MASLRMIFLRRAQDGYVRFMKIFREGLYVIEAQGRRVLLYLGLWDWNCDCDFLLPTPFICMIPMIERTAYFTFIVDGIDILDLEPSSSPI